MLLNLYCKALQKDRASDTHINTHIIIITLEEDKAWYSQAGLQVGSHNVEIGLEWAGMLEHC